MERLAILDHESHTLHVEDVSDEMLAKYDGEEEDYIEDHYALEDYSWDYIAATVYTAPDGEITTGVDFAKPKKCTKTCAVCGKQVTQGYLFDGTTCLCSKECATHFFADDEGCVEILIDDGDRLVWHDKLEDIQKFNIQTPADVARFFIWIVFEKHINFHPDDSFGDYENNKTHEPTFSPVAANYYDKTMQRCFDICEKYDRDIYKLAQLVMGMFCYCDCNDTMAKFCLGED